MQPTYQQAKAILEQYVSAFCATAYKIQVKNRTTDKGFWFTYSPDQLIKATGYLRKQNADGFDVYCRPVGYQFVLLDDLTRNVLADVAELQPCLLVETSPANYQAWLILADQPQDRETAKAICKALAQQFRADLASADPDHVGRLPGFSNRKEKHQLSNGYYPFVKLHRSAYRVSTFLPPRGGRVQPSAIDGKPNRPVVSTGNSQSENDFGKACQLIREGRTDAEIENYLSVYSSGLLVRKGKATPSYLKRTISRARQAVFNSN